MSESSDSFERTADRLQRLLATAASALDPHPLSELALQNKSIQDGEAWRQQRWQLSRQQAASAASFRFEHRRELIDVLRADPTAMARAVQLQSRPWLDRESLADLVLTLRLLEQFGLADDHGGTVPLPNSPLIFSCPRTLKVGETYTLLGARFGDAAGKLTLEVQGLQTLVLPDIVQWSDTAVMFSIPGTLQGVAAHSPARLTITRLAPMAGDASWTADNSTSIHVTLEPLVQLFFARIVHGDKGWSARPWYEYERTLSFESPALPASFELFDSPALDQPGVVAVYADKTWVVGESAGRMTLGTLSQPGHSLRITVTVQDDWYWDYEVTVDFYLVVPQGIAVDPRWEHH